MSERPCEKVIGRACFKAYPEFARRAIAYRLLHLLIPPNIAKLLPTKLKDPLIAPGVKIPLDAKFPPGTVLIPGCDFPAGWDPDQEPPACAKSAPLPPLGMGSTGANPNTMVAPGPSGPLPPPPPPPPPAEDEAWFEDNFDSLDLTVWEDKSTGGCTIEAVDGILILTEIVGANVARCYRKDTSTSPATVDLTFRLKQSPGTQKTKIYVYIADVILWFEFYDTNKVDILIDGWAYDTNVLPYSIDDWHTYKMKQRGTKGSFYQDDEPVKLDFDLQSDPGYDMVFDILTLTDGVMSVDYFKIEEV